MWSMFKDTQYNVHASSLRTVCILHITIWQINMIDKKKQQIWSCVCWAPNFSYSRDPAKHFFLSHSSPTLVSVHRFAPEPILQPLKVPRTLHFKDLFCFCPIRSREPPDSAAIIYIMSFGHYQFMYYTIILVLWVLSLQQLSFILFYVQPRQPFIFEAISYQLNLLSQRQHVFEREESPLVSVACGTWWRHHHSVPITGPSKII